MREREDTILQHAGEAAKRLGLGWEVLRRETLTGRDRADVIVKLGYPEGEVELVVEVKTRPTLAVANTIHQLERFNTPALLVADFINPKLGERLRARGVNFVDAAGNAHLRHHGLYVCVEGKKDKLRLEVERERLRAFQPSGLKLLFVLLCKPELAEEDYRTLVGAAGVALGTVQWVMRDLVREGYVLRVGRFERRLVEPKKLLDAWVPAYVRDLRPRLLLGRFEAKDLHWWRETDLRPYGGLWGGEPAAAKLTKNLKPGGLTIYADRIPAKLIARKRLKKQEAGRIEFRRKFWDLDNHAGPEETVPPVLVFADLLALAEPRAREIAEQIYETMIDGPFRTHLARWTR